MAVRWTPVAAVLLLLAAGAGAMAVAARQRSRGAGEPSPGGPSPVAGTRPAAGVAAGPADLFVDVTAASGIDFVHRIADGRMDSVVEATGTEPPTLKASEPAEPRALDRVWLAAEPVRLLEVVTVRVSDPFAI